MVFRRFCPNCKSSNKIIKKCSRCLKYICCNCSIDGICIDCYVEIKRVEELKFYNEDTYGMIT